MNIIKKIILKTTGYWVHKQVTLPVGADLFVDIQDKIRYPALNILFDVGANVGQTRYWFRFYLPKAKIYSFEPVKSTFMQLQKNAANDRNCILENMALGETRNKKKIRLFEGNLTKLNSLQDNLMNNCEGAKEEEISIETLDQYCQANEIAKIDFLKIDTEGYDINVLLGANNMLEKGSISFIYCEAGFQKSNERNTRFFDLNTFLEEKGYNFFGLYQIDYSDCRNGNTYGNALYVHKSVFRRANGH